MQEVHEDDATAAAYVPFVQLVQADAPIAEVVPAAHPAHADAFEESWYVPAPQAVHVGEPAAEYRPIEQLKQVLEEEAPAKLEYLPAAQAVQLDAPVLGPKKPMLHEEHVEAADDEYWLVPQLKVTDKPFVAQYVPAAQEEQEEAPMLG